MIHATKHVFWDHLPFWFIAAAVLSFMAYDIRSQVAGTGIYAPKSQTQESTQ